MPFRFYTNMMSQASRSAASGILVVGLLLIGFGALILALPELFAFLAAALFFLVGGGCAIAAIKDPLGAVAPGPDDLRRRLGRLPEERPHPPRRPPRALRHAWRGQFRATASGPRTSFVVTP